MREGEGKPEEEYSGEETARRRDEVIRRMANTPPQPRITQEAGAKKAKASAGGSELSRKKPHRVASAKRPTQD